MNRPVQLPARQFAVHHSFPTPDQTVTPPVVIVGTGPVGIRAAQELLRRAPQCPLVLYGDEPWDPYNRVQLSVFLAGEVRWPRLDNTLRVPPGSQVIQRHNCAVVAIDRAARTVIDASGRVQPYSALLLATGARPHIPTIPGITLPGVYAFHNMNDAQCLLARSTRSHHAVVLGGGVLGLEAARALQRRNTAVTIVQHTNRLMSRHLDDAAGALLLEHVLSLGIQVLLGESVQTILGEWRVTGVRLRSGTVLRCDTLVVAAGIKPNIQLAREAGLRVGRGVTVDDCMRTSDPAIYAVGDCAEHRNQVYGLVAPGLEQAAVAVHCIVGGVAHYRGSHAATRLKVVDLPVFSMGQVGEEEHALSFRSLTYTRHQDKMYRRLVIRRGRLVGAIAIGEWPELARLREAVTTARYLWPWQRARFRRHGQLWPDRAVRSVAEWPENATVCTCVGVTRGTLNRAIAEGRTTVGSLGERTGASRVCGSCVPFLAQLVGSASFQPPLPGRKSLLGGSLIALLGAGLIALLSPIPYAQSVQGGWKVETLWSDGWWKQASGYALLTLSALGLLLSLRKRWRRLSVMDCAWWRVVHVGTGALALIVLCAHTGLSLGKNANLLLMVNFLSLTVLGSLAGGVTALEARCAGPVTRRLRVWWTTGHILLFWPLLVLLSFHILSVCYF